MSSQRIQRKEAVMPETTTSSAELKMCGAVKGRAVCDFRAGHSGPHLDSALDVEWTTDLRGIQQVKRCCTSCDSKQLCHVCGDQTQFACSDCRIDLGSSVYICSKKECRDAHESKCSYVLSERIAQSEASLREMREALEEIAESPAGSSTNMRQIAKAVLEATKNE